jgi:ATPase subunit of ABC transporter with duplicated ATPase domains
VALCRLLLEQPDLLLLDEPTNHLDAESVMWLEGHLRNYPGAILIVTHDRYFLDNVTGWILELDRGRGIPYEGNYSSWLKQKQKRLEQEGREEEARQRTLAREQEWISASPRARQAKSKARYERYEELLKKAGEKQTQTAQIVIPVAERLGQNVIDFEHLRKGFGNNLLIDDLTFKLPPGGIVGIIGPNGAGKTTLFNLITGEIAPDGGAVLLFDRDITRIASRKRAHLGMARTYQIITLFPNDTILRNATLALLGLSPLRWNAWLPLDRQEQLMARAREALKRVGLEHMAERSLAQTSYGEKRRVEIAMALAQEPRVLLLDEPFAGLSIDERRDVRELLMRIPRDVTLVMIEHDMDTALDLADRITLLHFGEVIVEGTRAEVVADPRTREVYLGE